VTESLLPYGTTTYGRLAYQAELDKIAANVTTGNGFNAQVLAPDFDRRVQLPPTANCIRSSRLPTSASSRRSRRKR